MFGRVMFDCAMFWSCHVGLCHVWSCHGWLCHVWLCHVWSCHVWSCHVRLCHIWFAMFGRAMFGRAMFGRVMFGCAMFGRAMFRCAMLGRAMFGCDIQHSRWFCGRKLSLVSGALNEYNGGSILRPRPHYTIFNRKRYGCRPHSTPKTIRENGSNGKRSPEWNDLKTVLFENAVFLVWTAKTMISENDDVTTKTRPGSSRPFSREYPRW